MNRLPHTIALLVLSFSMEAHAQSNLLEAIEADPRFAHFAEIAAEELEIRNPDLVRRYNSLAQEITVASSIACESTLSGRGGRLEAMKLTLSALFLQEVLPILNRARRIRREPYLGKISAEDPIQVSVKIGDQVLEGNLEGEVIQNNEAFEILNPVIRVEGKRYFIAHKIDHAGPQEIALNLGFGEGWGGGQAQTVFSANPLHYSNWFIPWVAQDPQLGVFNRFVIFDPAINLFRPIRSSDINNGTYWFYYFPEKIRLKK